MAISANLFLAILSMDSYNRGYGAGIGDGQNIGTNGIDIDGLGESGAQIGNATVSYSLRDVSENFATEAQAAGFYAVAYTIGAGVDGLAAGTTVISYRGTEGVSHLLLSSFRGGAKARTRNPCRDGEQGRGRRRYSRPFRHGFRVPRHGASPE